MREDGGGGEWGYCSHLFLSGAGQRQSIPISSLSLHLPVPELSRRNSGQIVVTVMECFQGRRNKNRKTWLIVNWTLILSFQRLHTKTARTLALSISKITTIAIYTPV